MAIQIPNPGTGNGASGDNEFVLWSKVKGNFSDQTNAASRLVGTSPSDISINSYLSTTIYTANPIVPSSSGVFDFNEAAKGYLYIGGGAYENSLNHPTPDGKMAVLLKTEASANAASWNQFAHSFSHPRPRLFFRNKATSTTFNWIEFYTTGNTTKDSNGFIKGSSPVVDLYDDRVELNYDAKMQNVELVKNGTGDYTLKTKTGLRSDNTWQIEIPQDNNKNPLFAVDIDAQEEGTINIKCYKRIFSMETFLFGPDFNEPMDITEGRFISVRLNDNPEEQLDEPIE